MNSPQAIQGVQSFSQARVVYFQSGKFVHGPASQFIQDLSGYQPVSNLLTALAALNGTPGILVQTGATSFDKRTLTGTANQIAISNGDGTGGNPTFSLSVGDVINGTYTPTLTSVTNIQASTAYVCRWQRVGNFVTVSGQVDIDPTAAAPTASQIDISLPIASTLASSADCNGVASQRQNSPGTILGITSSNRAGLFFVAESTANNTWSFVFTYEVK